LTPGDPIGFSEQEVQVGRQVHKGKVHPKTGHEGPEGEQSYRSTRSLTLARDGGGWSTPRPGHFTPGKHPVPTE
jgi:hypothetical protein